ncbi:MAG: hypothetical protein AB7G06_09950 [Bdellovibrionales bacterium]
MIEGLSRTEIFAGLAIVVAAVRYITYLWSIYQRKTRPHAFSWFLWGLVTGIGAAAQAQLNGGPSVWVLTVVAATCLFISVVAVFVGEKNITRSDKITFGGALAAIVVWQLTSSPILALVCVILVDCLSYWPTIRKSWNDPWGEPPGSYFWAGLRYFLALFAVPDAKISTLLYPAFLMASDWGCMIYFIWRRKVLSRGRV